MAKFTSKVNSLQQSHRVKNHNFEHEVSLEKALDLGTSQGAAITELTSSDLLSGLAQLGGGGEIELGAFDGGVLVEQGGDDVVVRLGHLTGSQIADEATVALKGFALGQGQEGRVTRVDLQGGTTVAAGGGNSQGSNGQTLEEEGTTQDGGGTSGAGTEGQGGGGGGAGSSGGGDGGRDEEKGGG